MRLPKLLISLLFMAFVNQVAQAQDYTVSAFNAATYTPLANPTLITNTWDENLFTSENLGISMKLAGMDFSFDGSQQNGMLMFGAGVIAAGSTSDSIDFDFDGFFMKGTKSKTSSAMNYEIDGTSPNRIIKFEWKNAGLSYGDTSDYVNFQMWLYEATSNCEARFGASSIKNISNAFGAGVPGPNIGLFFASLKKKDNNKILKSYYLSGSLINPKLNTTNTAVSLNGMPTNGTVYTFVYGGTSGIDPVSVAQTSVSIYPNPATSMATIQLNLHNAADVNVCLNDITGKTIGTVFHGNIVGQREIFLNTSGLPKGMYILRITGEGMAETRRLIVQ